MSKTYRVFLCGGDFSLHPNPCQAGGPDHEPSPTGYMDWHEWAAGMAKTHRSIRCHHCHRFGLWERK